MNLSKGKKTENNAILSEEGLIALSQHFADLEIIGDKKLDKILLHFNYGGFTGSHYSDELKQKAIAALPKTDNDKIDYIFKSDITHKISEQTNYRIHVDIISADCSITLKEFRERLLKETLYGMRLIRARAKDYESMNDEEKKKGVLEYTLKLAKNLAYKAHRYSLPYLESKDMNFLEHLIKQNNNLSLPEMMQAIEKNYLEDKKAIEMIEARRIAGSSDKELAEAIVEYAIKQGLGDSVKRSIKHEAYSSLAKYLASGNCGMLEEISNSSFAVNRERVRQFGLIPLRRMGLNIEAIAEKEYIVGGNEGINPDSIRDGFAKYFAAYCGKIAGSEKEQKKIRLIMKILGNDEDIVIDEHMSSLSKSTRQSLDEKVGRIMLKGKFGSLSDAEKQAIRREMPNEMRIFLQSKPKNDKTKALGLVAEKFHPEGYNIESQYVFRLTKNAEELQAATIAAGSCIRKREWEYYAADLSDNGSVYLTAFHNKEIKGYARMFIMKNDKEEPVLAIDTIEPPKQDFEGSKDLIKAMCLASVQLGMDIGAKYIVCNDARINYGPKEAFGNTERKMKLTKIGRKDTTYYKMRHDYTGDVYVLMQNWRK
ncbi:MAG: hypothetical protein V1734_01545 [Nanoarchaeota archaeon]